MKTSLDRHQKIAYRVGLGVCAVIAIGMALPLVRSWSVPGPPNTGHAAVACEECHDPAPGSLRQQLQANVRYWLGLRQAGVPFRTQPVDNDDCLDCHANPGDLHPVYRFEEPRFAAARTALSAQRCSGCHGSHRGLRVAIEIQDCRHCHGELALREDPLDVSHASLVDAGRWETCLGCHDFHGNHDFEPPEKVAQAIDPATLEAYLEGGPSPYGPRILTVIQTMRMEP